MRDKLYSSMRQCIFSVLHWKKTVGNVKEDSWESCSSNGYAPYNVTGSMPWNGSTYIQSWGDCIGSGVNGTGFIQCNTWMSDALSDC